MLRPSRRRGFEHLDDPALDPAIAARSLADVALANRLFGGTHAVAREMTRVLRDARAQHCRHLSVLDVGTGLGDIPAAIAGRAARYDISLTMTGLEMTKALAKIGRGRLDHAVAGDARALPFADRSVDVVTCSQVLHHFDDHDAIRLLREFSRVARRRVIIADLSRSWIAMGLFWLVTFPLRFHPFSRHDGLVSIRRGFSPAELGHAVQAAVGVVPDTHRRPGWRVTVSWVPGTMTT